MSSLTDLRDTLGEHAAQVSDTETTARLTAVHHRVAVVRRRRRAAGTGVVALALVAAGSAALWPRGGGDALPAAPIVLGQRAPSTFTSLGYVYRTDGHAESFGRSGSVKLAAAAQPRLFSWTTDGAQDVTLTMPGGEVVHSPTTHFGDFVVVDPGQSGRLTVRTSTGHVALASYAVTSAAPAGVTAAGVTFRQTVAETPLLTARIGQLGVPELDTTYVEPDGPVDLHVMCSGLPKGLVLNVSLNNDGRVSGENCDSDGSFDPGSQGGFTQFPQQRPGRLVHLRAWISTGLHDATTIDAARVPDLRIGIGVYGPVTEQKVGGYAVPTVLEQFGHTWRLTASRDSQGAALRLPSASYDRVAAMAWNTHGSTEVTFGAVDGNAPSGGSFGGGQGGMPELWVPAGDPVRASLDKGTGTFGVALYERID